MIQLQCFNVWFVFFVTLTLFPTVMADIEYYSKSGKYDFIIPGETFIYLCFIEKFFTSITTYLLFNSCACFGSFLANFINWPKPKWLIAPVLCQAIFIPLMLFCNFRPHYRTWKIWIYDIRIYIIMAIVMSIGSGFYSAKAMMYAPKLVEVSKSTVAGMISAFFLIFGVLCGVSFTLVVSWFINSAGPYQPGKY
ncbi:unnamed protein product [Thelazia callipaeda]|uniref:Nucleoside transporter n=1 Tax=Thelazia callipaeda TaxID=103827 RepID=A0A0N5D8Q7_THECL|nr:unnamed protein product [Thelazia callipaeda]